MTPRPSPRKPTRASRAPDRSRAGGGPLVALLLYDGTVAFPARQAATPGEWLGELEVYRRANDLDERRTWVDAGAHGWVRFSDVARVALAVEAPA